MDLKKLKNKEVTMMYEFIDVPVEGGLKAKPTDTFEKCKTIVNEKAAEGWELVQVFPVPNEKTGVYGLTKYTIIFKVNK